MKSQISTRVQEFDLGNFIAELSLTKSIRNKVLNHFTINMLIGDVLMWLKTPGI